MGVSRVSSAAIVCWRFGYMGTEQRVVKQNEWSHNDVRSSGTTNDRRPGRRLYIVSHLVFTGWAIITLSRQLTSKIG